VVEDLDRSFPLEAPVGAAREPHGAHPTLAEWALELPVAQLDPGESWLEGSHEEAALIGLGDLDNLRAKALRKLPAERYQTVTALADDLKRYLRAEPVSARGHSLGYRIERFTRRNAMPLAAGVLIGAGLIASTIYSLAERREAERQRDTALAERRRADIQVDFQNVLLSSVGDRAMTMREVLDSARSVLGERRWSDERTHAALLLQLAGNYRELGDTRVRPVLLARADSIAVEIGDRALLARARCDLADLLRKHGEYPEAVRAADSALAIARESGDASMLAYCLDVRSVILGETRKGAAAVTDAREAVALKDSLGETHELLYFDILSDLAYALDVDRQSRRAVALQRRVLAAKDSAGQRYTVNFAIARHNLALMLMSLGETAEAEQLFHASLVTFRQSADTSWISPQALIHYAEAALRQGHADSALATFELLIRQARSDSNLWWEGRGRYGAARADVLLGRLDDAARANARLTHILKMQPKLRETENALPDDDEVRGMMELARNDGAAATASFMKALRTNGYFEGKDSVRLRPVVSLLARSALLAGDTHAAIEYARQAIAIARVDSLADFRSAYVGEARLVEAEALLRAGDTATARTEAMRAAVALGVGAGELDSRTIEARALVSRLMR
jgi:tetratricopeptide (TPR) repeat protein